MEGCYKAGALGSSVGLQRGFLALARPQPVTGRQTYAQPPEAKAG